MTEAMEDRFRTVEKRFEELTENFRQGRISKLEFIDSLKQLRFRDEEGKFWMVGAQSGAWHYFDYEKNDWIKSAPPALGSHKAICIYCGFENDLEAEVCAKCGGERADAEEGTEMGGYPSARAEKEQGAARSIPAVTGQEAAQQGVRVIWRMDTTSAFLFTGVFGAFLGLLVGLVVGVSNIFPGFTAALPQFFIDIQGKLPGAIIYPIFGAVMGFVVVGGTGFLSAVLGNFVLSLVGGLKIQIGKGPGGRSS